MKNQRWITLLTFSFLVASAGVSGQNFLPGKDAAFGQVAAGESIETRITVTNRGVYNWAGRVLFRIGEGNPWNPMVDGTRLTGGQYPLELAPDQTVTLRISDSGLRSGTAIFLADDLVLDNFLESNLTYFVTSNDRILDAIGVSPSREFYLASVPFEDFRSIGLALANGDLSETLTNQIRLDLITANGEVAASKVIELGPLAHRARFLTEFFPDVDLTSGKIEIYARNPIYGTALRLVAGELSSLPLEAAPVAYTIRMTASDDTIFDGELSLQAEGFFVTGMLAITSINGTAVENPVNSLVTGHLVDGRLRLTFETIGEAFWDESVLLYFENADFVFDDETVTGDWGMVFVSDYASLTGTYEWTRVTP